MALTDEILALNDASALALLQTYSTAQPASDISGLEQALSAAFIATFDVDPSQEGEANGAELARLSLLLLSEHEDHKDGIAALVSQGAPKRFSGLVETALLVPAVLVVLQTHLKFKRFPDGKWSIKIEKKPTDNDLLKSIVRKLLALK